MRVIAATHQDLSRLVAQKSFRSDLYYRISTIPLVIPALRDRARVERLFGFAYRIEVFVPEPKRQYGYYVFPVIEGDRLIGRLDARALRAEGRLHMRAFWPEAGQRMGKMRQDRLMRQAERLARFAGCDRVTVEDGWLRA